MSGNEINAIILAKNELVEQQSRAVKETLQALGLPSEGIIAEANERNIINTNLPVYVLGLDPAIKREAQYLSKFVVGAGFGLFDYALNAIWNEVSETLKRKAATYGIDIFFDAAVSGSLRAQYKSEADLSGLKDIVVLDTCRKLELISDITYKKLAHILDMRNNVGISHPTEYKINAFELLGWLQSCVQDVINDQPSEAAIQVKSFLDNLRGAATHLDDQQIRTITPQIRSLSSRHCDHLLKTIFGIFCAQDTTPVLRTNISKIAPLLWGGAREELKYKLGITLEGYNNNLHQEKYQAGIQLFAVCGGNRYKSPNEKLVTLEKLTEDLKAKHAARDNYYHEAPVIQDIMSHIQITNDIPDEIAPSMITQILLCRIGRGISYCEGVSPGGLPFYTKFFTLLSDKFTPQFIISLARLESVRRLENNIRLKHANLMISEVLSNVVSDRNRECLEALKANFQVNGAYIKSPEFRRLSSSIIQWNG